MESRKAMGGEDQDKVAANYVTNGKFAQYYPPEKVFCW